MNQRNVSSGSPPPFPPHPKQMALISQQQQSEPKITPKVKFISFSVEKQIDDVSIGKPSVSNLFTDNLDGNETSVKKTDPKYLKKREELIDSDYLNKVLIKDTNSNKNLNENPNENSNHLIRDYKYLTQSSNDVPPCCYAPPYIVYTNGCKNIKVGRYGLK